MKDAQIQNTLAKVMVGGTLFAAFVIAAALACFLATHVGDSPGDHVFSGEPNFFENPVSMLPRAFDLKEIGHRRSLVMIGVVLLLINPVVRVAVAAFGFALQKDRLYTGISLFVLAVLLFSFFW
jgi:uncharacterized membrane protein